MAGIGPGPGEDHRPGDRAFRHAAPQLAIDEVRQPPEQHAEGHNHGDIVDHPQETEPAAPGHPAHRHHRADQPAVEAHPAVPQLEQFERVRPQFGAVERGIAQPPAQDDPQRAVEEQVIEVALRHRCAGGLDHLAQVPVTQQDPRQIGQAVPAQLERSELEQIGLEAQVDPVNRLRIGRYGKR